MVVGRGDGCDVIGKNFAHEKCGFGIGVLPKDATQGVMAHEDGRSMDVLGKISASWQGRLREVRVEVTKVMWRFCGSYVDETAET